MGINYSWFKAGATTLPNQRVFNRYFKKGEAHKKKHDIYGLEITRPIAEYVIDKLHNDVFLKHPERYYLTGSMTNNFWITMAVLGSAFTGGVFSIVLAFVFVVSALYADTDFPWWVLWVTLGWNLGWLNFRFLVFFIYRKHQGAYVDRKHQTLSFTWKVKGNPPINELGHATFPLSDIEAFYSLQAKNQYGALSHELCIAHKDHDTYGGAFLQTGVANNPSNPNYCYMDWELIQRFADNTLPLPDLPDIEAYRHLDPLTIEYDKKRNRPEYYWRKMHKRQQTDIKTELLKEADDFPFLSANDNPKRHGQKEIEKPWLKWPISQKYFDEEAAKPLWKTRAKLIFVQLTIGI